MSIGRHSYSFAKRSLATCALILTTCAWADSADKETYFTENVLPILQESCFECHGSEKQKSNLRLDSLSGMLQKSVILAGDPESSRMVQALRYTDPDLQMPPDGKLSDDKIAIVEKWVLDGSIWPGTTLSEAQAQADTHIRSAIATEAKYWAFRPPVKVEVPKVTDAAWAENPIDAFVLQGLTEQSLSPSPEADKRTLIRRIYLDVLGLPPAPEVVDAFLADTSDEAYEKLVDRVLASPHYGERWARHWLDVIGFAETHGFETNTPRDNAWRFRDYVIRSFNNDIPYTQFIREQLAGDSLGADEATGFIVSGPWDKVKSPDVVLTKNQRDAELHNMVSTTASTFLGLTVGCAKCHDHKFDPIAQRDYFQMRAIFAGVNHGDREVRPDDYEERLAKAKRVQKKIDTLDSTLSNYLPKATTDLTVIDDDGVLFSLKGKPSVSVMRRPLGRDSVESPLSDTKETFWYWSAEANQDHFSWNPDASGKHQIWISWIAGRERNEQVAYILDQDGNANTTEDQLTIAEVSQRKTAEQKDDVTNTWPWSGFYNGGIHELTPSAKIFLRPLKDGDLINADLIALQSVENKEPPLPAPTIRPQMRSAVNAQKNEERFTPITAKALRITISKTHSGKVCIDELEVYSADEKSKNIALARRGAKPSTSSEYPTNTKHKTIHLNDGKHGNDFSWIPGLDSDTLPWARVDFAEVHTINRVVWGRDRQSKFSDRLATEYVIEALTEEDSWVTVASSYDRAPFGQATPSISEYATIGVPAKQLGELKSLIAQRPALQKEHKALVQFDKVYAGVFKKAEETRFLYRGDPMLERGIVNPGGISTIGSALQLTVDTPEHDRRKALAHWIASEENPLTARVMVNRIWHYHFGKGLVETPSDFGAMGIRPSHPELLDWLAITFMEDGWKPKALHRRILLSKTYRQSSFPRPDALRVDYTSRYLWRFLPRRMEAEPIRDSVLTMSAKLDLAMGGPGYNVFEDNDNYVRVYIPKKDFGPAEWRRMIYQYKPRMEQDETFGIFDCPDGGSRQPKRTISTTPLQALNMLNSPFINQQAKLFAERLRAEGHHESSKQAKQAFRLAFAREATPEELDESINFIEEQGLTLFCRAIYNSNEFLYLN